MFSATSFVIYQIGISWTWTQNKVFEKTKSWIGQSILYLCNIPRCLSKLQGWFLRILSISLGLSKTNNTRCSFWLQIVNLFVDLHNCLKVRAMASIFRKRGVRNWATSKYSSDLCSLDRVNPTVSFSEREKLVNWFANSSMRLRIRKWPRNKVSPHNPERTKIPLAQKVHLLPTENKLSSQRRDQHTSTALNKREKPLSLSGREIVEKDQLVGVKIMLWKQYMSNCQLERNNNIANQNRRNPIRDHLKENKRMCSTHVKYEKELPLCSVCLLRKSCRIRKETTFNF